MKTEYSTKALQAFMVLLITYCLMVGILSLLQKGGILHVENTNMDDIFSVMISLPFVALYLVILIAATAGFARGTIMAKTLPTLSQMFNSQLQKRKMEGASIKTKIRSGGQLAPDTPYLRALNYVISSRVPILAVIGSDRKVTGVITNHDIIRKLEEEIDKNDATPLLDRLKNLKVQDLKPRPPVVATTKDNLQDVMSTMIQNQYTKLIVVEDKQSNSFAGTVDVLDLVGELFQGDSED